MNEKAFSEVFFLRGYMRSGTNWLGRILNLHPDLNCQGEFQLHSFGRAKVKVDRSVSCLVLDDKQDLLDKEFGNFIKRLVRGYCGTAHKLVGDRTPCAIRALIVPDSKYLLIHRDGRDVIVSWFKHILKTVGKNSKRIERYKGFSNHPDMIDKLKKVINKKNYFERNKEELLDCESYFRQIAQHWNKRVLSDLEMIAISKNQPQLNLQILQIPYEELHANTNTKRNEIYSFLGVDPNLAKPLDEFTLPGYAKGLFPNDNRGVVGNWSVYFNETLATWFDEEAGAALSALGYAPTTMLMKDFAKI